MRKLTPGDLVKLETDAQRRVATGTKPSKSPSNTRQHIPAVNRNHRRSGAVGAFNPFDNPPPQHEVEMITEIGRAGRRQPPRTDPSIYIPPRKHL